MRRRVLDRRLQEDRRLDPRLRAVLMRMPVARPVRHLRSRHEAIRMFESDKAKMIEKTSRILMEQCDSPKVAPSIGLRWTNCQYSSSSKDDEARIRISIVRKDNHEILPCVFYIHGGGMMTSSCLTGHYRAWAKLLANKDLCVVMCDFRNSLVPAQEDDQVGAFPTGLDDCVHGIEWIFDHSERFAIDCEKVFVAGESGGGNLAIATALRLKERGLISQIAGIYALCPYIAGYWPQQQYPSSYINNGYLINLHDNLAEVSYGKEALKEKNYLAWPGFATINDLEGLPKIFISVNECDPLCDEGIEFYRKCLQAGVHARCRVVMGTFHGTELFPLGTPDISNDTAASIAAFVYEPALNSKL